jgi:hypothetical protein
VVQRPFTIAGGTDGIGVDLLMAWNPRRASPTRDRFLEVAQGVVNAESCISPAIPGRRKRRPG